MDLFPYRLFYCPSEPDAADSFIKAKPPWERSPTGVVWCNRIDKPGSVVNGHLSARLVTKNASAFAVPPADVCRADDPHAVLLRIGFTVAHSYLSCR